MDKELPGPWLEDQHRSIDAGILGIVDGSGALAALAAALELLRQHVYVEETVLFPPLEATGLTMPVFVMQREHGQLWPLLGRLAEACERGRISEDVKRMCRDLYQLLQIHNSKEEQILYAAANRLAAEDPQALSSDALRAAQVPRDWTCAMAAH